MIVSRLIRLDVSWQLAREMPNGRTNGNERETRPSNRRQMSKNKRKMESEPGNTFGVVLREYSRARKAIAFNCELE